MWSMWYGEEMHMIQSHGTSMKVGISCEILGVAALGTQTSGQGDVHPRYVEMGLDARVPKRAENAA